MVRDQNLSIFRASANFPRGLSQLLMAARTKLREEE